MSIKKGRAEILLLGMSASLFALAKDFGMTMLSIVCLLIVLAIVDKDEKGYGKTNAKNKNAI